MVWITEHKCLKKDNKVSVVLILLAIKTLVQIPKYVDKKHKKYRMVCVWIQEECLLQLGKTVLEDSVKTCHVNFSF